MPALLVVTGVRHARRLLVPTAVGAMLTIAIVAPYALAYSHAARGVGMRSLDEVRVYSASMTNYLSAPAMNRLYGWTASTDRTWADEMNLFPGVLACALALLGIVKGRGRVRFAYLAGLAASVEMTRGSSSVVYLWLFEHVAAFRALRSPARFDTLVNLSLGVLSAYGVAFLLARIEHRRWRHLAGAALVAVLIAEYASSPVIAARAGTHPDRLDARETAAVGHRRAAAPVATRFLGLARLRSTCTRASAISRRCSTDTAAMRRRRSTRCAK